MSEELNKEELNEELNKKDLLVEQEEFDKKDLLVEQEEFDKKDLLDEQEKYLKELLGGVNEELTEEQKDLLDEQNNLLGELIYIVENTQEAAKSEDDVAKADAEAEAKAKELTVASLSDESSDVAEDQFNKTAPVEEPILNKDKSTNNLNLGMIGGPPLVTGRGQGKAGGGKKRRRSKKKGRK